MKTIRKAAFHGDAALRRRLGRFVGFRRPSLPAPTPDRPAGLFAGLWWQDPELLVLSVPRLTLRLDDATFLRDAELFRVISQHDFSVPRLKARMP